MEDKANNDPLLERANTVLADGDTKYAMFLYRETLKKAPDNLAIRAELHKLRSSTRTNGHSLFSFLKQLCIYAKIFYQKQHKSPTADIIDSIEGWLDYSPNNFNGSRMIASAAESAQMYPLVEFSINEIPEDERTREDLLMIARALMEQKKFDKSLKIANTILEKSPDDPEAKDIVWKSSVDKQMNQKVDLVMADGIKKVAPPKVDASQIVMTNTKAEEEKDGKDGKAKPKSTKNSSK